MKFILKHVSLHSLPILGQFLQRIYVSPGNTLIPEIEAESALFEKIKEILTKLESTNITPEEEEEDDEWLELEDTLNPSFVQCAEVLESQDFFTPNETEDKNSLMREIINKQKYILTQPEEAKIKEESKNDGVVAIPNNRREELEYNQIFSPVLYEYNEAILVHEYFKDILRKDLTRQRKAFLIDRNTAKMLAYNLR